MDGVLGDGDGMGYDAIGTKTFWIWDCLSRREPARAESVILIRLLAVLLLLPSDSADLFGAKHINRESESDSQSHSVFKVCALLGKFVKRFFVFNI